MSKSPLIRTAVNLCLIAAMVIQPMALVAVTGRCAQSQCCEAQTACHGCKCCVLKTEGDLCGCGSGNEEDANSRCTRKFERPNHDATFRDSSDVVCVPQKADEDLVRGRGALSRCMCGIHSEPSTPAPHRDPVPQVRELVEIAYLDHVVKDCGLSFHPEHLTSRSSFGHHSRHFSQRFLSIWLI